jgi:hypothetical protein
VTLGQRRVLARRLSAYIESWPPAIVDEISGYFRATRPHADGDRAAQADRYWLSLPGWLAGHGRFGGAGRGDSALVRDVVWGQYCLFLFVRIHDDLFDGQARCPALVFIADALLVEAERSFARHLPRGSFWTLFRDLLDTSLRTVLAIDARQRQPNGMRREWLGAYGELASVLKVGAAAVCVKYHRLSDFAHVSAFADHLAIANQMVDDVYDLQEDFDRGRHNFAANHFGVDGTTDPGERSRRLAHSVLIDDAIGSLLSDVRQYLDGAAEAIKPLGIRQATAYVDRARRDLSSFAAEVHRTRVGFLLGPLLQSS